MLEAIRYKKGHLEILDQLLLPHQTVYEQIKTVEDGWSAIKLMKVRGAPAIALVGVLSLAVEIENQDKWKTKDDLENHISKKLDYLVSARPTAVNIMQARDRFKSLIKNLLHDNTKDINDMKDSVIIEAEKMLKEDIETNKTLSEYGAEHILENCQPKDDKYIVLTHCNTGSLATAKYGTALGVVRMIHSKEKLSQVYFTETRPYNQGSRLTAYEVTQENIPATMICDNMVAALMKSRHVSAVVVGADRVTANGDTANKIGTYQIALLAKNFEVPFYVACPLTTLDLSLSSGDQITIEERPAREMTQIQNVSIAPAGLNCWNPGFDVTPHQLVTGGYITEKGVVPADKLQSLKEV